MPFELPITIHVAVGIDRYLTRIGICPDCRAQSLQLKFDANGYQWRQCTRCAAVFVISTTTRGTESR
jgi:hypothetical protein